MKCVLTAAFLAASLTGTALAQGRCSTETLPVRGVGVTIELCVAGAPQSAPGGEVLVPLQAQYSARGGSFSEDTTLRFIAGERTSRVIRSVDLAKVGSSGTLHLTLVYDGSAVRVESAMLTPGAITIK